MDETEYLNRRLGQTLCGKWTLERVLGWGGMAAVYVGVHRIGRRDAIKVLHEEVAVSPDTRARFEQEAHAVNRLGHRGVVEVRDIDMTEDGCPFLVMELLEGKTLAELREDRGELPVSDVLRYADEVLDVLVAAHEHDIVHRDIKPDNIFVCDSGQVKVLDFGVARMKEGAPRTLVTRTGMAVGTLTYMAPEQVRGVHVDSRADVFAVGATIFRCLTGRRIHEGNTEADMLIKMATIPAPPLRSIAPDAPRDLARIVDRALQFEMAARYPDARTMQGDVRALFRGEPPPYAMAMPASVIPSSSVAGGVAAGPTGLAPTADDATRAEVPCVNRDAPTTAGAGVAPTEVSRVPTEPMTGAAADPAAPTEVDAASAVREPRNESSSNAPIALALAAGAVLLLFVLVGAVGVAWWALTGSGADADDGLSSSERNVPPTEIGETANPRAPRATATAPGPAGTERLPPASTSTAPTSTPGGTKTPSTASPPTTDRKSVV